MAHKNNKKKQAAIRYKAQQKLRRRQDVPIRSNQHKKKRSSHPSKLTNKKISPYKLTPATPDVHKPAKLVIKRHGHTEHYDEKKVYASVYAAALNCHYPEGQAEQIASYVMGRINAWVHKRTAIDSREIRNQILSDIYDEDVALMYKHHLDIC